MVAVDDIAATQAATIRVCKCVEDSIRAVSDAECMLARGLSLLNKFPRSVSMVTPPDRLGHTRLALAPK